MKQKVDSRADDRVGGAIKESEQTWVDLVGVELILRECRGIQEAIG